MGYFKKRNVFFKSTLYALMKLFTINGVYVVVSFLSGVIFVFLSSSGMLMYANKVETKEK